MRNGILKETDGWDILVDNVPRTFRDVHHVAIESARLIKLKNKNSVVEIRTRATGERQVVLPDGRLG